jgi:hypothetical protein
VKKYWALREKKQKRLDDSTDLGKDQRTKKD